MTWIMTKLQIILLLGVALAALQWSYSRALDREMPKGEALPWWGRYGPGIAGRKAVLYHPAFVTLGATLLLVSYFSFTVEYPSSIPTRFEMALVGAVFLTSLGHHWLQVFCLRRWVREDCHEIMTPDLLKLPKKNGGILAFLIASVVAGLISGLV